MASGAQQRSRDRPKSSPISPAIPIGSRSATVDLFDLEDTHVSFRWKAYREHRRQKSKVMRLSVGEFMRRFLLHVLPEGFHRMRHYGLFANGHRAEKLALCRKLLDAVATSENTGDGPINAGMSRQSKIRRPVPVAAVA